MKLGHEGQQEPIRDGDKNEVPSREEARAEREPGDLRDPREGPPEDGFRRVGARLLLLVYGLRFPLSSYS